MNPYVTFTSDNPQIAVSALLGGGVPKVSGYGGVSEVERVRRRPLTDSDSIPLVRQSFDVIFDGYASGASQDGQIASLETLAGLARSQAPLPVVRLSGPVRFTELEWLIESLDMTDDAIRDNNGRFLRAQFTVGLVQFVNPVTVASSPGTGARIYVVKKGDNLKKIAGKKLGDRHRWKEIARPNGLHKPGGLKVGTKLRIPAK